jgi:hypothetical protein
MYLYTFFNTSGTTLIFKHPRARLIELLAWLLHLPLLHPITHQLTPLELEPEVLQMMLPQSITRKSSLPESRNLLICMYRLPICCETLRDQFVTETDLNSRDFGDELVSIFIRDKLQDVRRAQETRVRELPVLQSSF